MPLSKRVEELVDKFGSRLDEIEVTVEGLPSDEEVGLLKDIWNELEGGERASICDIINSDIALEIFEGRLGGELKCGRWDEISELLTAYKDGTKTRETVLAEIKNILPNPEPYAMRLTLKYLKRERERSMGG